MKEFCTICGKELTPLETTVVQLPDGSLKTACYNCMPKFVEISSFAEFCRG